MVLEYSSRPAVLAVALDVTERKRVEEALGESEDRFRILFNHASDYMVMIDLGQPDGPIIVDVNDAACAMHGFSRAEMLGKPLRELNTPRTQQLMKERAGLLLKEGHAVFESEHVRKDLSIFPVEVSATVVKIGGRPYVFAIERDITRRKMMESQMLRMEKLESLGLLAGGIAHDFNNILMGVLGKASLARLDVPEDSELGQTLLEIETAATQAKNLTYQLLTFAKGGEPVKRAMHIEKLLEEATLFVCHGSRIKPSFAFSDGLWTVEADEGQLGQVIHNLVLNSVQAVPAGGYLHVIAENHECVDPRQPPFKAGSYVVIRVTDDGPGIPKSIVSKIFDPYFTTKDQGSGLGLASAQAIVKKHGGYIDVASSAAGTVFSIFLPAIPGQKPATLAQGADEGLVCGRILLMDDLIEVRESIARLLRAMGCQVVSVDGGIQALQQFKIAYESGKPFDAVILDLTVPGGMGGLETLEKMKRIDPSVRAIVSSGYSNDPVMANPEQHGFVGVLEKPYQLKTIQHVLAQVLGGDS
jgi:PAS domain S-box-containing protein